MTPESQNHVGKVSAGLHIVGRDFAPDEATALLGLAPTHFEQLGGKEACGVWSYDSTPHVASRDINDHLRHLLEVFVPRQRRLEQLSSSVALLVEVSWESIFAGGGVGPTIDKECIAGIAQIGASLTVHIIHIDQVSNDIN